MMQEQEMNNDHTSIYRRVQEYVPQLDKQGKPDLKQSNDS